MTHVGTRSARRGIADFLLRWGEFLQGSAFPAVVLDVRSEEVRLCNAAARARLGVCPRTLADALPDAGERAALLAAVRRGERAQCPLPEGGAVVGVPLDADGPEGLLLCFPAAPAGELAAPPLVTALVDDADDAFLGVDTSGLIVHANRAARRLLGDALVGGHLALVAPPAALLAASAGDGGAQSFTDREGRRRTLHWRASRARVGDAGEIVAVWGRDVTETHEAELVLALRMRRVAASHQLALAMARGGDVQRMVQLALQHVETLLPVREARVTLLEGDTLRPLAARRDGAPLEGSPRTLLSASPADQARGLRRSVQVPMSDAARYPGLRALEPLGVRCALVVPLQVEEAVFGFLELYSDLRERFLADELELVEQIASMVSASMVRERTLEQMSRHAQTLEKRVAMRNEELNRTQEQLIQAAKLSSIGELAAGLVHELNQPLNVLGGYVELLAEGGLPEAAQGRALDVMGRAVGRMAAMVDNLRNFSRSGAPTMHPVDLEEVVRMARELTAGAPRRGVEIECAPGVRVFGDTTRLEQVVINLVANALQVDGDPVHVRVHTQEGERAVIDVADRGPGVPEALRDRIFDAFFTTKPAGQGTGLGLSVSARIVQEHGGRIEVLDNPGGGALFRVVLPLYRERER